MSETSQCFVAELGDATPEVETRLIQWVEGSCVEHRFVRDERNRAALYFARGEGRTVRQMQSLLRTLTSRWGRPLGPLEAGWLQPLSVDEYRAAVSTATAAESACEPPQITVPTVAPPLGPCTAAAGQGVFLESLPPGFDTRAEAAYLTLLRSAAMAQAAY